MPGALPGMGIKQAGGSVWAWCERSGERRTTGTTESERPAEWQATAGRLTRRRESERQGVEEDRASARSLRVVGEEHASTASEAGVLHIDPADSAHYFTKLTI